MPLPPSSSTIATQQYFNKEVVLLDPECSSLPRGKKRALLHDKHQIADVVEFGMYSGMKEVVHSIEDAFKELIDLSKPHPR